MTTLKGGRSHVEDEQLVTFLFFTGSMGLRWGIHMYGDYVHAGRLRLRASWCRFDLA
jgi:hypothetical protein